MVGVKDNFNGWNFSFRLKAVFKNKFYGYLRLKFKTKFKAKFLGYGLWINI
jgi:hypothetical protein